MYDYFSTVIFHDEDTIVRLYSKFFMEKYILNNRIIAGVISGVSRIFNLVPTVKTRRILKYFIKLHLLAFYEMYLNR